MSDEPAQRGILGVIRSQAVRSAWALGLSLLAGTLAGAVVWQAIGDGLLAIAAGAVTALLVNFIFLHVVLPQKFVGRIKRFLLASNDPRP
jgi:hypothetical protein